MMKNESRRTFVKKAGAGIATLSLQNVHAAISQMGGANKDGLKPQVFFTTGFKTGEVTPNSAQLWVRLCAQEKRNPVVHQRREEVFRHPLQFDENMPVEKMDGAVAGANGMVRAIIFGNGKRFESAWSPASAESDFGVQIPFTGLDPGVRYEIRWQGKLSDSSPIFEASGSFSTAPLAAEKKSIRLVTSTCQYFWSFDDTERGFRTYDSMKKLNPDFFVHTGDYVYYDKPGPLGNTIEKARHQWHAMNSWPSLADFFSNVPIYMLKDDHDLLRDDAYPTSPDYGQLSFKDGLKIWRENAPVKDSPYRTFRWGKHVQIWLVEGREFRSPNPAPDSSEKTIWGSKQKAWFQQTVDESDATFKILFSPTPVVGPDRDKKTDNHANKSFQHEGNWLRQCLAGKKNMFVVNGDRHWQYVSVDEKTGLIEFGSGPVSDAHAQGWDPEDKRPEHRFLRVKGGFLEIDVKVADRGFPRIEFIHRDVDGLLVHQETFSAS
jgi:alkaline phosphatase D